jgi:hypothetical protein
MAGKVSSHVRSNIYGLIAIFIALSGSAYAAITLEKNQVKSKHIGAGQVKNPDLADNAVTSPKVADGSLLGADFAPGQLPAGERGPVGPPGEAGADGADGADGSPDTPQQVLDKIKQVDGGGSGLVSDLLDGQDSSAFLGANASAGGVLAGNYPNPSLAPADDWTEVEPVPGGFPETGQFYGTSNCGWTNHNTTDFNSAGFYRDPYGIVRLKGIVKFVNTTCAATTGNGEIIFELPLGYRPVKGEVQPAVSADAFAEIDLRQGRQVIPRSAQPTTWVSLDGISFRCAPSGSDGCP